MRLGRSIRRFAIVRVCFAVVMSVALAAPAVAGADDGGNDRTRHPSGLVIMFDSELHPAAPKGLRDVLGAYDLLAEANPEDFGYPHVANGAIVVDVATDRGLGQLAALRAGKALPLATPDPEGKVLKALEAGRDKIGGDRAATRRVAVSRAATERLKDEITAAASADMALAAAGIWQTEVDRTTGRVIVRLPQLTDAAAAALVARYGTDRIAVVEEPNPESVDQFGRLSDSNPFWGGARISTPRGSCTDAFSWNISATGSGMLTAGHCIPDGGGVSTPSESLGSVTSGSRENYSSQGTVYLPGQTVYRGDMALAQVAWGKSSSATIYRGAYNSTSSSPVREMWSRRAQPGDQYCVGGSYGGETCGWTVGAVGVTRLVSGMWKRNFVVSQNKQGWCTRPGDSGGSVYTVRPDGAVAAKGIHNMGGGGGSDNYGGALDPCTEGFTDIWDAYWGFPGYLNTR